MKILLQSSLYFLFTSLSFIAHAADSQGRVIIVPLVGAFDSTDIVAPVGGNYATTLGEQRKEVFERAAFIWSNILDLDYDITVEVQFTSMTCSSGSATLGYAGPNRVKKIDNVWYTTAQANQINKTDTSGTYNDIYADFNSDIDEGCYDGAPNGWYYGLDNNEPSDQEGLLDVVLHEIGHGLGHLTFVDGSTGELFNSYIDSYSRFLTDNSSGWNWADMTDAARLASNKNNQLIWAGELGNALANSLPLTNGLLNNSIQMHAPSSFNSGSSVSHISTNATPNQLMEPYNTDDGVHPVLEVQMFKDMGYKLKSDLSGKHKPVASDYTLNVVANGSVHLDILNHITDTDSGDTFSLYTFNALPSNGSLSDNLSIPTTYTPDTDFTGSDSIQYQVYDSFMQLSNQGTITINVQEPDDAPIASDDSMTLDEDSSSVSINVLSNDTDDGTLDSTTLTITSPPSSGSANVVAGNIVYTPNANFYGSDNIEYTVKDNAGQSSNTATVSLTVNNIDDAPTSNADSFTIVEDSVGNTLNLITNDSDIDSTLNNNQVVIISQPQQGSVNVNGSGVSYTPAPNYHGDDGFSYRLDVDGNSSNTTVVSITITNVNDAPITTADNFSVNANSTTALDILVNDSDVDHNTNQLTIVIDSQPSHGSIAISGSNISYSLDNQYSGNDSFSYYLKDADNATSNSSIVSLNITNATLPVAQADHFVFDEDIENARLNLINNDEFTGSVTQISIIQQPENGTISVNGTQVSFTGHENTFGQSLFSYRITDETGLQSLAVSSSIMLMNTNDAPRTKDDTLNVASDIATRVNLLKNDTDEQITHVTVNIHSQPRFGALVVNNNQVHYTLNDLAQNQDSFTYSITDSDGVISNTSTVTLLIVNGLPLATTSPDEFSVKVNSEKMVDVIANDTLYSSDYTLSITQGASSGIASIKDNKVYYEADSNTGSDNFAYTITDGQSQVSLAATVTINKTLKTPLMVSDDHIEITANSNEIIDITGNDEFDVIDALEIFTDSSIGQITKQTDNQIRYQATQSNDSFVYCITDNGQSTQCAQVYFTVIPSDDNNTTTNPTSDPATEEPKQVNTSKRSGGGAVFYLLVLSLLFTRFYSGAKGEKHE